VVRCAIALFLVACAGEQAFEVNNPIPRDTSTEPEELPPLTELCINEFMADNASSWLDDQGVASDWVELHNPTAESVSLYGYFLSNDADDPFTHRLDDDLWMEPGEYLVFSADGQPELGPLHLSFRLSSLGESLGLFRYDGAGEILHYGIVEQDVAWSRSPDCCPDAATCMFQAFAGSPGASNPEAWQP